MLGSQADPPTPVLGHSIELVITTSDAPCAECGRDNMDTMKCPNMKSICVDCCEEHDD